MKKIVIILLLPLLLGSCFKDNEDIFDSPAAERIAQALREYQEVLVSSEYGWSMEYYPQGSQAYGGYMYTLQFTSSEVKVRMDLSPGKEESSLWRLISDNGPVLTFDTYNSLLHYFSTPYSDLYQGLEGDYEFILMSKTDTQIILQGKKTGNKIVMNKLTVPAKEYMDKVEYTKKNAIAPIYKMNVNGEEVSIEKGANRTFTLNYEDGGKVISTEVPYIYTDTGIRFYQPVTILGSSIESMQYSVEQDILSTDNGNAQISFELMKVNEFFAQSKASWYFSPDEMSDFVLTYWKYTDRQLATNFAEATTGLSFIYLGYYKDESTYAVVTGATRIDNSSIAWWSYYSFDFIPVKNTENEIELDFTNKGYINGGAFWTGGYQEFVSIITNYSPYIMEADNPKYPTKIKFTSIDKPEEMWFTVSAK